MLSARIAKTGAAVAACAAMGAGATFAVNASAPSTTPASAHGPGGHRNAPHLLRHHAALRRVRRAVHAEAVIPVAGGKFATVIYDRGTVEKVEGQQLTLREGTKTATYKTVTLTIPDDAKIRVNGRPASLADVKPDQRAFVVQGPNVTRVFAAARHG
jgi:hypothetical protein